MCVGGWGVLQLELGTRLGSPNAIRKKPFCIVFTRPRLAPIIVTILSVLAQNLSKEEGKLG